MLIQLWDVSTGRELAYLDVRNEYYGVVDLTFSPDGTLLAAVTTDGYLYVFDILTGKTLSVLPIIQAYLDRLDWSSDGSRIAMTGYSGAVHIVGIPR